MYKSAHSELTYNPLILPDTNIFMLAEWGAARLSFYTLWFVDSKVDIYFVFVLRFRDIQSFVLRKNPLHILKGSHKNIPLSFEAI